MENGDRCSSHMSTLEEKSSHAEGKDKDGQTVPATLNSLLPSLQLFF